MELFWRKGFDNTSIADLTTALGLNPPSLYAAFGSKEKLFDEAVALYLRAEGGGIWDRIEDAPTAREAIAGVLHRTAAAFAGDAEPRGCMIVLASPQMEGANPAVCDRLKALRLENLDMLKRRLERAVREGELPVDTDCNALASYFMTVQHGMSIQARDGASPATLTSIADCATAGWDALVQQVGKSRVQPEGT